MTQACLRRASVVIPGTGKCDLKGEDDGEVGEGSGTFSQQESQLTDAGHSAENSKMQKIQEKIQEGLERTISTEAKEKIEKILNDANQLSDVEKLLLYLKLPTGSALAYSKDGSAQMLQSSNRLEQIQAVTWIKSHLEEHSETSLPKQEVFDDYKMYCEGHGYKFLSQGDFGKVMKCVFPNVKPRRLGQRGQSKHCYGGLRKKLQVALPTLPDVSIDPVTEVKEESDGIVDEVLQASCELVCEWAQKLLNQQFSSIKSLAEYLVTSTYVNGRSMAAFTVLAAVQKIDSPKTTPALSVSTGNSSKHRETQLQLQRKLQEREMLREQKRKLELYGDLEERQAIEITPDWTVQARTTPKMETAPSKPQTAQTAQKLLLPKTSSANGTAKATAVTNNIQQPQTPVKQLTNTSTPMQTNSAGQSILVFSPTAHLGQSGSVIPQQLLILSPISNGTAHTPVTAIRPQMTPLSQTVTVSKAAPIPTLLPMQQVVVNTLAGQPQTMAVTTLAIASTTPSTLLSRNLHHTAPVALASTLPALQQAPLVTSSSQILTHTKPIESLKTVVSQNGSAFMPVSCQLRTDHGLGLDTDSQTGLSEDSQGLTVDLEEMTSPASVSSPSSSLLSPTSSAYDSRTRPKLQARTVSSMLKEQRGTNIVAENKSTYVNDSRPVAALLKESRQRQALVSNGNVISSALSPTLMIQTVAVSNAPSAIHHNELSNGVLTNTQPLLTTALLQVNQPTAMSENSQLSPPSLVPVSSGPTHSHGMLSSVPASPQSAIERARHCSGPEHKADLARHLELNDLDHHRGLKRELQAADLPRLKRTLLANDSASSDLKQEPKDDSVLSMAASFSHNSQLGLAKHLLRTESLDKDVNISQDKENLLDYLDADPAPDLNDITPSIDQIVTSQEGVEQQHCVAGHTRVPHMLAATAASLGVPAAAMMMAISQKNLAAHPVTNGNSQSSNGNFQDQPQVFTGLSEQQQQAFLRRDVLLSQAAKPFPNLSGRMRHHSASAVHHSAGVAVKAGLLQDTLLKSNNNSSIRRLLSANTDSNQQTNNQNGLPMSSALSRMARRAQSVGSASQQQQQQTLGGSMPASPMLSPTSNHDSVASANSTPVPSPGSATMQDLEQPTAAFMPIQTSQHGISNTFTLVRPTVTTANTSQAQMIASLQGQLQNQVIQLNNAQNTHDPTNGLALLTTTLQGPILQTASDLPSAGTGRQLISKPSNPTIRQRLAQKLKEPGTRIAGQVNDPGHFVSASSIKPVKRGQKAGVKAGTSKRQRHHSAQSALGSSKTAASSPASVVASLPMQLNQAVILQHSLNQQVGLRQLLNPNPQDLQPNPSLSEQTNGSLSLGPSNPDSPFSPEMQDIFGSSSISSQPSFRSQSVPVSETFYTGSDNQDLFHHSTALMLEQRDSDYLDSAPNADLASLLHDRLHDQDPCNKTDMFGARRNLTELLETPSQPGGAMLGSLSHCSSYMCKRDMMLTSLSLPDSVMESLKPQNGAPTPPTSKNPTPDFSHELSSLQHPSGGMGSLQGASNLDTPSSLDTMSTHSRESLTDHLFQNLYDSSDMGGEVSSQDIDMITPDYFQGWEMPQMVHD